MARTALIIEDDAMQAMAIEMVLESLGYQIVGVADTEAEAIELAIEHEPDLITSDCHLRDGLGPKAIETIRTAYQPHVVYMSGDPSDVHRIDPTTPCLQKPFSNAELKRAIAFVTGTESGDETPDTQSPRDSERDSPNTRVATP